MNSTISSAFSTDSNNEIASVGPEARLTQVNARLGGVVDHPRMEHVETYKQRLITRLHELDSRLARIEESLDAPHNPDFEEDAVEREGDEVRESLGEAGLLEIRQIQAALKRMRVGEYGVCVNCGADISTERLDAVPAAPRCRYCA